MQIQTILDQIDLGAMALPEFQRGYVWNREQVRGLMYSLYRKHPVGSLLVWATKTENADARGDQALQAGSVKLLLDGQQRITWSGEVPSQKWTKFYSQVLAKFAVGSDLKIRVTFEATADAAQAKAKLDEARVQLRELGLNDEVG